MSMIYQPNGKAREYADWACNVYLTCDHGCLYCYVPQALHLDRADFHGKPNVRKDFDVLLDKDAAKQPEPRNILLSFACDPYSHYDVEAKMTRRAIEILHRHGHSVTILTKGGVRALRDVDLLVPGRDVFASSLTLLDEKMSLEWEPNAAPPTERMSVLHWYYEQGYETWVSLEPVIDPAQTCEIILLTHGYVGHYKVGKLNYHPLAKTVDWRKARDDIEHTLFEMGAKYMLKESLAKA